MSYTENLQSLWNEARNYLELQKEYVKLDAAEKLSVLLSAVAIAAVCLILAMAALLFFVVAFGFWLADYVGTAWSFTIMGGSMLVFIIIAFLTRKRWIVQPVSRFIARLLVNEDEWEEVP